MQPAPGETFGRFVIQRTLGSGGMGHVYLAVDPVLERRVALKLILPESAAREEAVARFRREARLAAQLEHPNTVRIYELGEQGENLYLVMEYVEGKVLSSYLGDAATPLSVRVSWLLDLTRALHAAHERGLVHRDVKPGNVLVSSDGVVKLLDFGLAKRRVPSDKLRATFRTDAGFVVGTPLYMAPEQLAGATVGPPADQFAWGLLSYALLTGRHARSEDPELRSAPDLAALVPGLSPRAAQVIARALSIDPEARFASMADLGEELHRAWIEMTEALSRPRGSSPRAGPVLYCPGCAEVLPADRRCGRCGYSSLLPPEPRSAAVERLPLVPSAQPPAAARDAPDTLVDLPETRPVPLATPRVLHPLRFRFRRSRPVGAPVPLRAVAFGVDGTAVAFGEGAARLRPGADWESWTLPSWLSPQHVRAVHVEPRAIVVGGHELAAVLPSDGEERRIPLARTWDPLVSFGAVTRAPDGELVFVGGVRGTASASGVVAREVQGRLLVVEVPAPLFAVATVPGSSHVVAFGARGYAALTEKVTCSPLVPLGETDALAACADGGSGVYVVGRRGTACFVDAQRMEPTFESVETSEDLLAVTSAEGDTWAVTRRGQFLRRVDGEWRRWSPALDGEPDLLAVWAGAGRVRAIARDGSVVEGEPL